MYHGHAQDALAVHGLAFGAQSVGQQESGERHAVAVVRDGLAGPHSTQQPARCAGDSASVSSATNVLMMRSSGVVMELG